MFNGRTFIGPDGNVYAIQDTETAKENVQPEKK